MKNILVTGAAGFIGANLVLRLLDSSEPLHIVGLDNMNSYYDPSLKEYRLRQIEEKAQVPCSTWAFVYGNIADRELVNKLWRRSRSSYCGRILESEKQWPDFVVRQRQQTPCHHEM